MIDYKPLNQFLHNNKFPFPKVNFLFVHLQDAMIFLKFDLKARFWKVGIHPGDNYKTVFYIPSAQYQWKVLPFELNIATSFFQKTMTEILEPILYPAVVYIDDILLFSKTKHAHEKLL